MPKVYYRKLIRDNVPAIMDKKRVRYSVRELGKEEYLKALRRKLIEEATELSRAKTRADLLSELADVLVVIEALLLEEKFTQDRVMTVFNANKKKKGGFDRRLFLEWSEQPN